MAGGARRSLASTTARSGGSTGTRNATMVDSDDVLLLARCVQRVASPDGVVSAGNREASRLLVRILHRAPGAADLVTSARSRRAGVRGHRRPVVAWLESSAQRTTFRACRSVKQRTSWSASRQCPTRRAPQTPGAARGGLAWAEEGPRAPPADRGRSGAAGAPSDAPLGAVVNTPEETWVQLPTGDLHDFDFLEGSGSSEPVPPGRLAVTTSGRSSRRARGSSSAWEA
jgi:hypothetical protein